MPDIDLLASKLNHKVQVYDSWRVDPPVSYAEAFSLDWAQFPTILSNEQMSSKSRQLL